MLLLKLVKNTFVNMKEITPFQKKFLEEKIKK